MTMEHFQSNNTRYFDNLQTGHKKWFFLATKPSSRTLTLPRTCTCFNQSFKPAPTIILNPVIK
jgi:hypothetical protein